MYTVEHTDTFGGEANYCWVNRYDLPHVSDSRRAKVRQAKALCGLTGHRCDVHDYGGDLEIRPRGLCQVIFVTWEDRS